MKIRLIDRKGAIITREDEVIISQNKFYEICGRDFKIMSSMALFDQGWMTATGTG